MKFLELAKTRHSVRKYIQKAVEKEKLSAILEAANVAPTTANLQPQRILVLQEKESLEKLAKVADADNAPIANIFNAPLVLILCCNTGEAWQRPEDEKTFEDIDIGIVSTHMMLQAAELGLGSVMIGNFKPEFIKEAFSFPMGLEPALILAIGYAAGEPASLERHSQTRKPLLETTFYEKF